MFFIKAEISCDLRKWNRIQGSACFVRIRRIEFRIRDDDGTLTQFMEVDVDRLLIERDQNIEIIGNRPDFLCCDTNLIIRMSSLDT